jgi:hypothetical protein
VLGSRWGREHCLNLTVSSGKVAVKDNSRSGRAGAPATAEGTEPTFAVEAKGMVTRLEASPLMDARGMAVGLVARRVTVSEGLAELAPEPETAGVEPEAEGAPEEALADPGTVRRRLSDLATEKAGKRTDVGYFGGHECHGGAARHVRLQGLQEKGGRPRQRT